MNEFTYLDVYATKNIEYLLVVGVLVLFVIGALLLRDGKGGPR